MVAQIHSHNYIMMYVMPELAVQATRYKRGICVVAQTHTRMNMLVRVMMAFAVQLQICAKK